MTKNGFVAEVTLNSFFNEECLSLEIIKGQFWDLAGLILQLSWKINLERYPPGFCMFF